jgi:hypothetical protein
MSICIDAMDQFKTNLPMKQSKKPSVPMGHTHMDIDRMFSLLSEEMKKSVSKGPPGHRKLKKSVVRSLMKE